MRRAAETRPKSYSSFAEDDVRLAGRVDVDVGTTDDEHGVLLASDSHLSHARHRLQPCTDTPPLHQAAYLFNIKAKGPARRPLTLQYTVQI